MRGKILAKNPSAVLVCLRYTKAMQKQLEHLGLSEKESRVYLASLTLGKATADQLSKHAKVNRSTTYVQIEALEKLGLMSRFEEGKKTYFTPESPEGLHRVLTRQKEELLTKEEELARLLPELVRSYEGAGERPMVRFFEGKEGISAMREEMLRGTEKEWRVIYSHDNLAALFSEEEREVYTPKRSECGITSKMIYTREDGPFENPTKRAWTERKFISPSILPLDADIVIYGSNVTLTSLKGKPRSVAISDSGIAKSLTSIFDLIWEKTE
jgi:HTH-type transcriptional regulator, sugar sensing transcriptional regulator